MKCIALIVMMVVWSLGDEDEVSGLWHASYDCQVRAVNNTCLFGAQSGAPGKH